jgi:hypothetical protein
VLWLAFWLIVLVVWGLLMLFALAGRGTAALATNARHRPA